MYIDAYQYILSVTSGYEKQVPLDELGAGSHRAFSPVRNDRGLKETDWPGDVKRMPFQGGGDLSTRGVLRLRRTIRQMRELFSFAQDDTD